MPKRRADGRRERFSIGSEASDREATVSETRKALFCLLTRQRYSALSPVAAQVLRTDHQEPHQTMRTGDIQNGTVPGLHYTSRPYVSAPLRACSNLIERTVIRRLRVCYS